MQTATIHELKKELNQLRPAQLVDICLQVAKFKKDNKELLTYLLFESQNEAAYIESIKHELDTEMAEVKSPSVYLVKKSLRKILRQLDKYIRCSGNKQTEAELRMYFLRQIKAAGLPIHRSQVLSNIYNGQLKKIKSAVSKLHEDLQYDFGRELEEVGAGDWY